MNTSVTFKNIEPSDHLKSYVQDKLNRFDKLLDYHAEANVFLSIEKFRHIAEINLIGDRLNINCKEETTENMYSAIDIALNKLEKQIKKSKQKVRNRRGASKTKEIGTLGNIEAESEEFDEEIIVEDIVYKPMDIEEAVMQMGIREDDFFVFTNSKTDRVNVLYHRNDGKYGLIQPRS
ncbi:MAG: ribosome-associated translation inhibitor RaiA [Desulfobacterales bacterium]|nr:ribosome-associated translation inhibitor RaiA [Desulfobacterales bacterium]